jgi:hypothetical protein
MRWAVLENLPPNVGASFVGLKIMQGGVPGVGLLSAILNPAATAGEKRTV